MKAIAAGIALALLTAACASNPKETSLQLSAADPKYDSEDCKFIRNKVLDYDDKVGERALTGLALGIFLGPFGIPIAAGIDANQSNERELMNKEIQRRCVTGGDIQTASVPAQKK